MPLTFDPGDKWDYGINIDWVGTQLRVTISPTPPKPVPPEPPKIPETVAAEIASETAKIGHVRVPETLAHPHPLIRK